MNNFKKILTVLLIVLASGSFLYAESDVTDYISSLYSLTTGAFSKTSARVQAMGGAGIAVKNNQDSLYLNPASLGARGLVWDIPNVSLTIYNAYDLNSTGILTSVVQKNVENTLKDASFYETLLNIYGATGFNNVAKLDAGFGVKWGRFASATDVQVNFYTANEGTSISGAKIIPQIDIVQSLGLGFRFFRDSAINFDLGVAARLNFRAFLQATGTQELINAYSGGTQQDYLNTLMNSTPLIVGYAIPIDVGMNVNFPYGFTVSSVLRNINGNFKYTYSSTINGVKNSSNYVGIAQDVFQGNTIYTSSVPMSLDFGIGWTPDFGSWEWLADLTLAADFTDTIGFIKDDLNGTGFWSRVKLGAEFELFKVFEFRAGLNSGYVTVGGGFNLFNVLHLEIAYYTTEFGTSIGEKPVDALTFRFNTFWER